MSDPIQYSVQPHSVDFSGGPDALSVVTLTVTGTNNAQTDVACTSVGISLGDIGTGQGSLTADPSTVAVAPGPVTPWAIGGGGTGAWTAVPLPPVTGIAADTSVTFILADVVVNEMPGTANVIITEVTDHTRTISLPIKKDDQAPPGSTPTISSFTATPTEVAQGGTSTLAWEVADATSCVLRPEGITVQPSASLPLTVPSTTTYILDAYGTGGSASAKVTVVVGPVKIISFTADPPGPITAGTSVVLSWVTHDAIGCSIDQRVGPVATSGQVSVKPSQTTVYTLSALGLEPQASALTVNVSA
jgi:hypothetical protein